MSNPITIEYVFEFPGGETKHFKVELDRATLAMQPAAGLPHAAQIEPFSVEKTSRTGSRRVIARLSCGLAIL